MRMPNAVPLRFLRLVVAAALLATWLLPGRVDAAPDRFPARVVPCG